MEIQTFFLAEQVKATPQNSHNITNVAIHSLYTEKFPLEADIPFYMLLARSRRDHDEEITLRFNLIDESGQKVGAPIDFKAKGNFPMGHKFIKLNGTIRFLFEKVGDYRLDITVDEEKIASVFSYNIEITVPPEGAPHQ